MREYSNIEIIGDLTLRRGAKERIVTDSNFYSEQFGQAAYKTDIGSSSSGTSAKFYGISSKLSDDSFSVTNIGLFTFADEFYISQNSPNTDEVILSLGSDGVRTLQVDNNLLLSPTAPTTPFTILDCTIKANELDLDGAARAYCWGTIKTRNGLVSLRLIINVNGTAIYDDQVSINTTLLRIPWELDLLLYQTSPTRAGLSGYFNSSNNVNPGGFGIGALTAHNARVFGNFDFAHDITADNTLTATLNFATANNADKFYRHCAFVEAY